MPILWSVAVTGGTAETSNSGQVRSLHSEQGKEEEVRSDLERQMDSERDCPHVQVECQTR